MSPRLVADTVASGLVRRGAVREPTATPAAKILLADPTGEPLTTVSLGDGPLLVLVGPEGGLSTEERAEVVAAGAQLVRIAPHILRIETAAMAMASCLVARSLEDKGFTHE